MKTLSLMTCLLTLLFVIGGCSVAPEARTSHAGEEASLSTFPDMNNLHEGYYHRIQGH